MSDEGARAPAEPHDSMSGAERIALLASLAWLGIAGYLAFSGTAAEDDGRLLFILTALMLILPVLLVWIVVRAGSAIRQLEADAARLDVAIEALRQSYVSQGATGTDALIGRLDEITKVQRSVEARLIALQEARSVDVTLKPAPKSDATPATGAQPTLALGTTSEDIAEPLSRANMVRALHFPENADDTEGFAALRLALKDRQGRQIVQAAQDVLTLLSQDGIYMDDLTPGQPDPDVWRAFAQGARGADVARLGGVRDRSSLALAGGRMKQDTIFRDAAHHFLRVFDRTLSQFEDGATDADITAFASTRSARAFMLLGRVAGTFD